MNEFRPGFDHRSARRSRLIVAAALCSVGALAGFAGCTTDETADPTTTSSGSGGTAAAATTGSNTTSAGTGGADTVAATSTGASMSTSTSASTGGGEPAVPSCNFLCNTASDCTASASGAFDVSHYSCTNQTCVWKGCKSAQECIDTYKTPNWECSKLAGSTVASCNFLCATASDCTGAASGAFDVSHYSCTNQTCVWKGCKSAQECIDTYKTPNWECSKLAGSTVASCNFLCTTASDCTASTSGAFDASHYSCTNQTCVWNGCNSTQECIDTYKTPNWECK